MRDDPGIDWVRKVRHEISARFDHDPKKVVEYYMELQKQYEDRLIKKPEAEKEAEPIGVEHSQDSSGGRTTCTSWMSRRRGCTWRTSGGGWSA